MHCLPAQRIYHGLNGYREVIDTIFWGLKKMGHRVTYTVNDFSADAVNIVFGSQILPIDELVALPRNTIIYNLEQMRSPTNYQSTQEFRYCAENFRIWDYSPANLRAWQDVDVKNIEIVPIGYAPVLSSIPKARNQDIDVLFYGSPIGNRLDIFKAICGSGLKAMFVSGFYGAERDELIARSKIVLNVPSDDKAGIFEIVRVSYLWANKKAVIADLQPNAYIEDDIKGSVKFSPFADIVKNCHALIEDYPTRVAVEEAGFAAISKRDITAILKAAAIEDDGGRPIFGGWRLK